MSGFEREPSDQQKMLLVDEALYLRGRIIAAYAQVEFLLADSWLSSTCVSHT
jgi:hypothetical protein